MDGSLLLVVLLLLLSPPLIFRTKKRYNFGGTWWSGKRVAFYPPLPLHIHSSVDLWY
jgi:hypothetical protein